MYPHEKFHEVIKGMIKEKIIERRGAYLFLCDK